MVVSQIAQQVLYDLQCIVFLRSAVIEQYHGYIYIYHAQLTSVASTSVVFTFPGLPIFPQSCPPPNTAL